MMHLGWFLSYNPQGWNEPHSDRGNYFPNPDMFVDFARAIERAGFDYMMMEDSSVLPNVHRGTFESSVKNGGTIRFDPVPLIPFLTQATKHIGIIATISTSFYHPFMAARLFSTLDHVTRGRVGMNLVTSSNESAMQNYGLKELIPHDERYARANEWVDVVKALWDSWDEDAVVMDEANGVFADHNKVHTVDFEGKYYRSRGPLNTIPGPQRHPVICQAGGSGPGRDFGARNADTIIAAVKGVEEMKAYRDDITARREAMGLDPKGVKVLYLIAPVLADSVSEAEEKNAAQLKAAAENIDAQLAGFSYFTSTDWSKYDIDAPFPDLSKNEGHQSTMNDFARSGATIREAVMNHRTQESVPLIGTPETVAQQMEEYMDYAGGDGYLVAKSVTRQNITEIADGLAPALRKRGVIRSSYDQATFRDNLLAY